MPELTCEWTLAADEDEKSRLRAVTDACEVKGCDRMVDGRFTFVYDMGHDAHHLEFRMCEQHMGNFWKAYCTTGTLEVFDQCDVCGDQVSMHACPQQIAEEESMMDEQESNYQRDVLPHPNRRD